MGDDPSAWEQPDYYKLAKAAKALNMDFDRLNEKPEPARSIMIGWGMVIHNAEAEVEKANATDGPTAPGMPF